MADDGTCDPTGKVAMDVGTAQRQQRATERLGEHVGPTSVGGGVPGLPVVSSRRSRWAAKILGSGSGLRAPGWIRRASFLPSRVGSTRQRGAMIVYEGDR
eukprot:4622412-Pyramimonas_sp.AAC.1